MKNNVTAEDLHFFAGLLAMIGHGTQVSLLLHDIHLRIVNIPPLSPLSPSVFPLKSTPNCMTSPSLRGYGLDSFPEGLSRI